MASERSEGCLHSFPWLFPPLAVTLLCSLKSMELLSESPVDIRTSNSSTAAATQNRPHFLQNAPGFKILVHNSSIEMCIIVLQFPGGDVVFSCDGPRGAILWVIPAETRQFRDHAYLCSEVGIDMLTVPGIVNSQTGTSISVKKRLWGMASYHAGRKDFNLAFKPTVWADTA
ncbi:hypothetical protein B0H19DRAFT_1068237 [Mycena capillaripes]|nr:hypothetical protein B0H19DRAFT_1068237 [Mycena capillaripes]